MKPFISLVLAGLLGALPMLGSAQTPSQPTTVAGWSFGSTGFTRNATTQASAVVNTGVPLSNTSGLIVVGRTEAVTTGTVSSGYFAEVAGWPAAESGGLNTARTSFSPVSSARVLWSSLTFAPNTTGDLSTMALSLKVRRTDSALAPTKAKAWVTWSDAAGLKTRSSLAVELTGTAGAWSTVDLPFSQGTTAFPAGAALAGRPLLLELQLFGGASDGGVAQLDDLVLTTASLTGSLPLSITTVSTLPTARVDKTYAVNLAASGGSSPYSWSVVAGSLPAGLTLTSGKLSGTPTAAGSSSFTLLVTDSAGTSLSKPFTLAVLAADRVMSVGNLVFADLNNNGLRDASEPGLANVRVALYPSSAMVGSTTALLSTVTNSSGAYAFRDLAPGQYVVAVTPLASHPTTGGMPVTTDNQVNNDNNGAQPGGAGTVCLSPVITLALGAEPITDGDTDTSSDMSVDFGLVPSPTAMLTIAPTSMANATLGLSLARSLSAAGGQAPFAWTVSAGQLPAGLALSSAGVLSGTPTALGSSSFTVQAIDVSGITGTRAYTMSVVSAPLFISPASLPAATVGTAYTATLVASGASNTTGTAVPATWAIASGALLPGLMLDPTTGIISGTPTTVATSSFTVRATAANGSTGQRVYQLAALGGPITITPTELPAGTTGSAYSQTLSASGGTAPYLWTLANGVLPAGLTLNSQTGVISGTPLAPISTAANSQYSSSFTVVVTDSLGSKGGRGYSLRINTVTITVAPSTLPEARVGAAYQAALSATGGTAPYTWGLVGTLPPGLTLSASGAIAGTPTLAGTSSFGLRVTDSMGNLGMRSYNLTVLPATTNTLVISPTTLPELVLGRALTPITFTATGGTAPYTWAIASGVLPAGISLSSAGVLTGTPTVTGNFSFALRVTDTAAAPALPATGLKTYSLSVKPGLTIMPSTLPTVMPGLPFSLQFTATGGTAPYLWTVASGTLPTGLTLSASTGLLSGTVTSTNTASSVVTFSIRATDSANTSATRTYSLVIAPPVTSIVISPATLPEAKVGTAYSATFSAIGGTMPYLWSITSGSLPPGLTLSTAGVLTGTATASGSYTFAIRATDSATTPASGTRTYTLAVKTANTPTLVIGPSFLPEVIVGMPYSVQLGATGGATPYAWSVANGTLPTGLSLNATTGLLSGTVTSTGAAGTTTATSAAFAIRATDSAGVIGVRSYSLAIIMPPPISIMPTALPSARVGSAFSTVFTAAGGTAPYTWSILSSALPPGLTLSITTGNTATLSGTPTTAATVTLPITVTDATARTSTKTYTLIIQPATSTSITIAPLTLMPATVGTAFLTTFTATGGTMPYTWSITSGSLPSGLTLSATTGVLSGTPTTPSSSTFTVRATDAQGLSGSRSLTLIVGENQANPSSFALWLARWNLPNTTSPSDDSDHDEVSALIEYALGTSPLEGQGIGERFRLQKNSVAGGTIIAASYSRPAINLPDIRFVVESLIDLGGSPAAWQPIASIPSETFKNDGSKEVTHSLSTGSEGFARLSILLDADMNGTAEARFATPVWGWQRISRVASNSTTGQSITLSNPFILPAAYTCRIESVGTSSLMLTGMAGAMLNLSSSLVAGRQYYAEIQSGPQEGHRLEIDEATTAGSSVTVQLATAAGPSLSTLASLPTDLIGATVSVRPHRTLSSAYEPSDFVSSTTAAGLPLSSYVRLNALLPTETAVGYTTYVAVPTATTGTTTSLQWLKVGASGIPNSADSSAASGLLIPGTDGFILQLPASRSFATTFIGQVRANAFATPLGAGTRLIANPWPRSLTTVARRLDTSSGFVANADLSLADTLDLWNADSLSTPAATTTSETTSFAYTFSAAGTTPAWLSATSTTSPLFLPCTASFIRTSGPRAWVQPRPWQP